MKWKEIGLRYPLYNVRRTQGQPNAATNSKECLVKSIHKQLYIQTILFILLSTSVLHMNLIDTTHIYSDLDLFIYFWMNDFAYTLMYNQCYKNRVTRSNTRMSTRKSEIHRPSIRMLKLSTQE